MSINLISGTFIARKCYDKILQALFLRLTRAATIIDSSLVLSSLISSSLADNENESDFVAADKL